MYKVPGETSDAGKRILTNYNNSKMMIEGNGVTISEDYKSHWFLVTNVTTYNYHRHAWKSSWESYSYTMRIYANYNNTRTMNGAISGARHNVYSVTVDKPYTEIMYLYAQWSNDTNHDIPVTGDYQQPGGAPSDPTGWRPNVELTDNHTSAYYRFKSLSSNTYNGYYNPRAYWTGPGIRT